VTGFLESNAPFDQGAFDPRARRIASQTVCVLARDVVGYDVVVKSAVHIRHIFISAGHNFFGRHGQPAGKAPTVDVRSVRVRAGFGLEGDRFYGYRPDYHGQVTFFEWEVFEWVRQRFEVPGLKADAFRRNVIVEGIHLNELIGSRFSLGWIDFEGMSEAKPCYWMKQVVAVGAEQGLRGRGGLRAKILTDGELHAGPAELCAHGLLALG
jgi:MOSC domain-containing protein YiiM